ncbi:MAG: anti-sigma factor domain-containing protein [Actinomycetes bacterium]
MARERTPAELEDLLGAYALDAVDADEAEQIERYLEAHPEARAEVAQYRETASMLAFAGADAPSGLWHSIVASLEDEPPRLVLPVADPTTDLPPLRMPEIPDRSLPAVDASAEARTHEPAVVVVPIDAARERRTLAMRVVASLAAAALVVVALIGLEVGRQSRQVEELTSALDRNAIDSAAALAARTPGARTTEMRSQIGGRSARIVLLPDGSGFVTESNLERLPADRTYQLWALVGDAADPTAISAGVLGSSPDTVPFRFSGPAIGFAITDEVRPGVVSSEQAPVVVGTF